MILGSLLRLWMCRTSQHNQTYNYWEGENLTPTKVYDMPTKLAGIGSTWGTGPATLKRIGVLEYRVVFSLAFIL